MNVKWFFYNYSSSTAGDNIPQLQEVTTVLGETESTIKTFNEIIPIEYNSARNIIDYQWLPIIGGDNFEGCSIYIEIKLYDEWIKVSNGVFDLNDIVSNFNTIGGIDRFVSIPEWDKFGLFTYRVKLYIPTGKSVSNFFFGLLKTDK